jgi:drug/metabolite transporter (DMT)-like permease
VSVGLAAVLLGESIGPSVIAGAILVILGVYVGAIARPAGAAPAPAPR